MTTVEVDGAVVEASKYTITEGKVTLDKSLFTEAKAYSIVIKANGYTNATVSQTIEPEQLQVEFQLKLLKPAHMDRKQAHKPLKVI